MLEDHTESSPSPKCGRVGNKRCVANGHYADCEIHPGSFHSIYTECVKCANQKQLEEQEQRAAMEKTKEDEDENKSQRKKKTKTPKVKPDCEKSMKQLRKEKKERRRTGASDSLSPWWVYSGYFLVFSSIHTRSL